MTGKTTQALMCLNLWLSQVVIKEGDAIAAVQQKSEKKKVIDVDMDNVTDSSVEGKGKAKEVIIDID